MSWTRLSRRCAHHETTGGSRITPPYHNTWHVFLTRQMPVDRRARDRNSSSRVRRPPAPDLTGVRCRAASERILGQVHQLKVGCLQNAESG